MAVAFLIGRFLLGGYFVMGGLNHFLGLAMYTQGAAAKGVPLPEVAIVVSGALLLIGGVSILLGWQPALGIAAIVIFLVPVSIFMHNFWAESGPERMADMINFT